MHLSSRPAWAASLWSIEAATMVSLARSLACICIRRLSRPLSSCCLQFEMWKSRLFDRQASERANKQTVGRDQLQHNGRDREPTWPSQSKWVSFHCEFKFVFLLSLFYLVYVIMIIWWYKYIRTFAWLDSVVSSTLAIYKNAIDSSVWSSYTSIVVVSISMRESSSKLIRSKLGLSRDFAMKQQVKLSYVTKFKSTIRMADMQALLLFALLQAKLVCSDHGRLFGSKDTW